MSEQRAAFVERFGEDTASAIERAAESHKNGLHDKPGSDYFRWALLIAIGYECMSHDKYRKYHGITTPWADLDAWMQEHRDWIGQHDGECDYLSLFSGAYSDYIQATEEA